MTAGSSSALTGRDAAAIQSSAAVMPAGGDRLRVPGLNAQANSARRSVSGSGAPRRRGARASVTVVSASAAGRRGAGGRGGHFVSVAAGGRSQARPFHLGVGADVVIPAGGRGGVASCGGQAGGLVEGQVVADGVF